MKLVRNDQQIKRNKLIGNVMTFTSLGVLGLGLYFAFQRDMSQILYSYVCLIVGFLLTQIGLNFVNRYGRSPRYDEILGSAFENYGMNTRIMFTVRLYQCSCSVPAVCGCRSQSTLPEISATKMGNGFTRQKIAFRK